MKQPGLGSPPPADPLPQDIPEVAPIAGTDPFAGDPIAITPLNIAPGRSQSFVTANNNVLDSLRGTHIISNQEQLNDFAQIVGLDPAALPIVDFQNQALIYNTRDANGPQASFDGRLDDNNTLRLIGVVPAIGFFPSDETAFDFYAVDRTGISALATEIPVNVEPLI